MFCSPSPRPSPLYMFSGARPSSGAETQGVRVTFAQSDAPERADVAAAEDGRTPLNTYSPPGRGRIVRRCSTKGILSKRTIGIAACLDLDPSRPGLVKVNLASGGITVKGYDGKEVVVEARLRGTEPSKKGDKKIEGLKRIEIATTGLTVEEEDNVVSVSTGPMNRTVDLTLQVPSATSLKLGCMNDGGILVQKVEGEIEVNNLNGPVTLTHVSGVVVAHSQNGEVLIQMDKVTPDKPMSFSTLNGDIDVTLPPDIKAKVRLETQNGAIYSDFEIGLDRNPRPPAVEDGRKEGGRTRIQFDKGVVGTINGGGPEIQFKTVNGNIQIRKGKQ